MTAYAIPELVARVRGLEDHRNGVDQLIYVDIIESLYAAVGGGTVSAVAPTTDNALVRWDGTDAGTIQNSDAILDDSGNVTFTGTATAGGMVSQNDLDLGVTGDADTHYITFRSGSAGNTMFVQQNATSQLRIGGEVASTSKYFLVDAANTTITFHQDGVWLIGENSIRPYGIYSDNFVCTELVEIGAVGGLGRLQLGTADELDVQEHSFHFAGAAQANATSTQLYKSELKSASGSTAPPSSHGYYGNDLEIYAGNGSDTTFGTNGNGGDGGTLDLRGGAGGLGSEGGTDGAGGDVLIEAGAGGGGSTTNGDIVLGATNAYKVLIGRSAGHLGFHGAAGVAKQTVTGSTGANAALQNLLTALATLGLITDSTT